jgi:outer membrane protein assembly factor BamB
VNVIKVSSDQTFFVSGSDDGKKTFSGNIGTVKIWDTRRLEKNVVNTPRLSHFVGRICFG